MKRISFFLLVVIVVKLCFAPACLGLTLEQKITVTSKDNANQIELPPSLSVKVSAQIEGYLFNIEGLTSPWAQVSFFSTQGNIDLETIADDQGVFRFSKALMPLSTGDFCFISIDTSSNGSPPLCFSPPPPQTETSIVGIVLPPSLTIEENVFHQNDTVSAGGKTSPDSQLNVYLFEDENPPLIELIDIFAPKVGAREGPTLSVFSDEKGEFTFNLPSTKSTSWRMFVGTQKNQLGQNPSPKSNILQFASLSWWKWLLLLILIWFIKIFSFLSNLFFQPLSIIVCLLIAITAIIRLIKTKKKFSRR
jgi:hypothetical protein